MASPSTGERAPLSRASSTGGSRQQALVSAEARRLAREARALGPLPLCVLARSCRTSRWRSGNLEAAVREGVRRGELRLLGFDFVAAGRPAPTPGREAGRM